MRRRLRAIVGSDVVIGAGRAPVRRQATMTAVPVTVCKPSTEV